MKVTRTGMTTVIAQAYAAYKRSGPVEETAPAAAGGMAMGDQPANNWLREDRNSAANRPATAQPALPQAAATTPSTATSMNLPRKGGTDIMV